MSNTQCIIARALITWQGVTTEIQDLRNDAHHMPDWACEDRITDHLWGLTETVTAQAAPTPEGGVTVSSPHLPAALHAIAAAMAARGLLSERLGREREYGWGQRPPHDGSPTTVVLLDPDGRVLAQASSDDHPQGVHDSLREAARALALAEERVTTLIQRGHDLALADRQLSRLAGPSHTQIRRVRTERPRTAQLMERHAELALDRAGLPRTAPTTPGPVSCGPLPQGLTLHVRRERAISTDAPATWQVSLTVVGIDHPDRRPDALALLEQGAAALRGAGLTLDHQPPVSTSDTGRSTITSTAAGTDE